MNEERVNELRERVAEYFGRLRRGNIKQLPSDDYHNADQILALLAPVEVEHKVCDKLTESQVEWIVNDSAELGVKIGSQFFFLYKGESLVYEDGRNDDGSPMMYRPVFKREFGECCHPINYNDPTRIGTVSLSDSEDWSPINGKVKVCPVCGMEVEG